jgi:hypothetical protein
MTFASDKSPNSLHFSLEALHSAESAVDIIKDVSELVKVHSPNLSDIKTIKLPQVDENSSLKQSFLIFTATITALSVAFLVLGFLASNYLKLQSTDNKCQTAKQNSSVLYDRNYENQLPNTSYNKEYSEEKTNSDNKTCRVEFGLFVNQSSAYAMCKNISLSLDNSIYNIQVEKSGDYFKVVSGTLKSYDDANAAIKMINSQSTAIIVFIS